MSNTHNLCDKQSTHSKYGQYPLYFQLTFTVFVILSFAWSTLMFLLWPGMQAFGIGAAMTGEVLLALFPIVCWVHTTAGVRTDNSGENNGGCK